KAVNAWLAEEPGKVPWYPEGISGHEVSRAAGALPNGKAPGPDGIPNCLLRAIYCAGPTLAEHLAGEFGDIIRGKRPVPREWLRGEVITLYKGTGDPGTPSEYRPITLGNTICKLYERVMW